MAAATIPQTYMSTNVVSHDYVELEMKSARNEDDVAPKTHYQPLDASSSQHSNSDYSVIPSKDQYGVGNIESF